MATATRRNKLLVLPLILLLVSACASAVTRPADVKSYSPALAGDRKAGKLTVEMTPDAREMAGKGSPVNETELLLSVFGKLRANDAITQRPDSSLPEIEVLVTRVASNFVLWAGLSEVSAVADVTVRAPNGTVVQRFSVNAVHANPYALHEYIATLVTKEVTGKDTLE